MQEENNTLIENNSENSAMLEAILFASGYPVTYEKLAIVFNCSAEAIKEFVKQHVCDYVNRGIELITHDDCCLLCTKSKYEDKIKTALDLKRSGTLSNTALEVLAIIARNQPCTKSYVEQVRGIDSSYSVNYLTDRGLIEPVGKLDVPGRPNLYATTEIFLRTFGINSLDEINNIDSL